MCTADICNGGSCESLPISPCTVCPPWVETWAGVSASGITARGWEIWSNPTAGSSALGNWRPSTSGDLGPDEHVRFNAVPWRLDFDACLITPPIDTSGEGPCSQKPLGPLTMRFQSSFAPASPGVRIWVFGFQGAAPPEDYSTLPASGWPVLGTFDGSVQTDSWANRVETFDLSGSAVDGIKDARFAFCVEGPDSFSLEQFSIGEVRVGSGVEPGFGHTCVGLTLKANGQPAYCIEQPPPPAEVTVVLGQTRDVLIAATNYSPFATSVGLLEFSVEGGPPYVAFEPGPAEYEFTGYGYFWKHLHIDPPKGAVPGDLDVELVVSDGFLFERWHTLTIHQMLGDGYLIWQPGDVTSDSGAALEAAITGYEGRPAHRVATLDHVDASGLAQLDGIFVVLGSRGANHVLTAAEATKLRAALLAGARVYLEGGEVWGDDTPTGLHPLFHVLGTRGLTPVTGALVGRNLLASGQAGTVSQWGLEPPNAFENAFVDSVDVEPGAAGAFPLLREGLASSPIQRNLMVGFYPDDPAAGLASPFSYRTVASALGFAALAEAPATGLGRDVLLRAIVDFFETGRPPCTAFCQEADADACQCDDGNPCTIDICNALAQCENKQISACAACATDLDCEDAYACRVADGVCVPVPGRRVRVTPKLALDTLPGTADRVVTIDPCPVVGSNQIAELALKVRLHHTWRGQVRLTLTDPAGVVYPPKGPDPADARDGIYETYDLGVNTGTLPNAGPVCVPGQPWTVRLQDTLPGVDSGFIDEVSLFVSEKP